MIGASDNDFFYANQIRATTGYRPDLKALSGTSTKIVVGVGATSAGQLAHRGGLALAEHLGLTPTEFPGGHGGFAAEAPPSPRGCARYWLTSPTSSRAGLPR
jgi:hypothetical protein